MESGLISCLAAAAKKKRRGGGGCAITDYCTLSGFFDRLDTVHHTLETIMSDKKEIFADGFGKIFGTVAFQRPKDVFAPWLEVQSRNSARSILGRAVT